MIIKKILHKIEFILFFQLRMTVNRLLELPAQTTKDRKVFKKLFDNLPKDRKLKIFEWGTGFSTIYYAKYLTAKGIDFEWHSVDNNRIWHDQVKDMVRKKGLAGRVHLCIKDFIPFWEKPGWVVPPPPGVFSPKEENEKAYVEFPKTLNEKFDLVIIDARFRRHCIQTAKEILKPESILVVHDAQKPHYQIGLEDFPYGKFIDTGKWWPSQETFNKVWIGSMENKGLVDSMC